MKIEILSADQGSSRNFLSVLRLMKRSRSHLSVVVEEVAWRDLSLFPRYVPDQMRQLSARSDKIPSSFEASWNALMAYRSVNVAPVDTMGCERLFQQDAPPNAQRYQVLN